MNKIKNILIVTHQFIPHQSPRTTRWKLLYDELIKSGFNVTVVTGTLQTNSDSNIRYIGNRNEDVSSDVYEFIVYYYGELAIPLPSQVKFRNIINSVFLYFDAMSGLINTNTTLLDIENIDQNYFF